MSNFFVYYERTLKLKSFWKIKAVLRHNWHLNEKEKKHP
jgi:hypothetical protein